MADLTQFVRGRAVIDRRGPTEGAHEVSCIDARLDRLRLHDAIPEPLTHLTCAARALRAGHVVVAGVELFCLSYVWLCACTNRRDKLLWAAITVLVGDGVGLVVGRGDCPLGPQQERSATLYRLVGASATGG